MITQLTPDQEEHFRNLHNAAWGNTKDYYHDFRALAQEIVPTLSDAEFDRGWEVCLVDGTNYNESKLHFIMVLNGTY